jgi:flagellar protein FliS
MGVTNGGDGMAGALGQLYEAARRTILDSALSFDTARITALREDFTEIGAALRGR